MAKVFREKEMDVPIGALRSVISDFESYPKFLTEVKAARILGGDLKSKMHVSFELEIIKRFQYELEFSFNGGDISWVLTGSNFFKTNTGKWNLTEKSPSTTHVLYELDVSFGFLVPGWISSKLTETSLPKMLDSFEKRAKENM